MALDLQPVGTRVPAIFELLQEGQPSLVVNCPGLAQVAGQVTLVDERRQYSLGQGRSVSIGVMRVAD